MFVDVFFCLKFAGFDFEFRMFLNFVTAAFTKMFRIFCFDQGFYKGRQNKWWHGCNQGHGVCYDSDEDMVFAWFVHFAS